MSNKGIVNLNPKFTLGGTDLTTSLQNFEFGDQTRDALDTTVSGGQGHDSAKLGLKTGTFGFTLVVGGYGAGTAHNAVLVAHEAEVQAAWVYLTDNSAVVSSTNPQFSGNCVINSFQIVPAGDIGELFTHAAEATINGDITFAVS